jgi:hypothetical protein
MPLDINGAIVTTDDNGEFRVTLQEDGYYIISSGLPNEYGAQAITFTPVPDSGLNLGIRSPLVIEMQRNITLDGPICRALQNGVEVAYFPYRNTAGVPVQLPLEYSRLNQIFSPRGEATPPELFVGGKNGFFRPLSAFVTEGTYAGAWHVAGQQLVMNGKPPVCTGGGDPDPGTCTKINMAKFNAVWSYTATVVRTQVNKANSLAGVSWFPKPRQRLAIFGRGATVLSGIRNEINKYADTYSCEAPLPDTCTALQVNKRKLTSLFDKLYSGTPEGLEALDRLRTEQKSGFSKRLKALPNQVAQCSNTGGTASK